MLYDFVVWAQTTIVMADFKASLKVGNCVLAVYSSLSIAEDSSLPVLKVRL